MNGAPPIQTHVPPPPISLSQGLPAEIFKTKPRPMFSPQQPIRGDPKMKMRRESEETPFYGRK